MPEGPETRRAADRLARVLVTDQTVELNFPHPNLTPWRDELAQSRILEVTSRGKALLIRFENGLTFYSHSQLYGRWTVQRRDRVFKTGRSLRAEFLTPTHTARLWSATEVRVLSPGEEATDPFLSKLGPDVLDTSSTPRRLLAQLDKHARKSGAHMMLDQSVFAGLGNYLRSEILFEAGVYPDDRPIDLEPEQRLKWAQAIRRVTRRAYREAGVTVPAAVAKQGKSAGEPRRTWRHWVFCRNDKACRVCNTTIERRRYGGRRLDFCPTCQPARRLADKKTKSGKPRRAN
ncbi:MAG: endonuclease VIII [Candidatus Binatia bacterium]|nr:endonuclease VIII [Candidatus Binatia bacterium]